MLPSDSVRLAPLGALRRLTDWVAKMSHYWYFLRMTLDEIRAQWRAGPKNDRAWRKSPDQAGNERGQCQGEFFECDDFPYQAYLKPGKIKRAALDWPAPAYEKISADLAYDLACPVPVVQIWEREEGKIGDYACYSSLSLKEFPKKYSWGVCKQALAEAAAEKKGADDNLVAPIIKAALARTSGMLVLDTWLGQCDRGDHPGNVALSYDPEGRTRAQFSYFDFAQTMNYNGNWKDYKWKAVVVTQQPPLVMSNLDKGLIKTTYDRLMAMSADSVREIANRLVCKYFDENAASYVSECLLGRRQLLQPVIAPYL